ncbi:MAG: hypothetical protein HDS77_06945 [Bacteroidales bacterium]|nr:hypothetical protein [Bacteroidales bacterium]
MKHPEDENIRAAYEVADESGKKMLCALYPELLSQPTKRAISNRPVMERVKTFDDACHELGETHPLVQALNLFEKNMGENTNSMPDVLAFLKLRLVTAALNEGWAPDWNDKQQRKWYPWFYIYSEEEYNNLSEEDKCRVVGRACNYAGAYGGLVYASANYASSYAYAGSGSRLAFKSKELAKYCGEQFGELWAMFHLG